MDAEEFGGSGVVAVCLFDGLEDEFLLHLIDGSKGPGEIFPL